MKKGCFLKVIIAVTVLVAAITYIFQNKFNDFIFKPGRKIIAPILVNNFNDNLKYIKNNRQKDSLKILVKNYLEEADNIKEISGDSLKTFFNFINSAITDSQVTPAELKNIKNFIDQRRKNERPKKN